MRNRKIIRQLVRLQPLPEMNIRALYSSGGVNIMLRKELQKLRLQTSKQTVFYSIK